jgi:hypothetical protein
VASGAWGIELPPVVIESAAVGAELSLMLIASAVVAVVVEMPLLYFVSAAELPAAVIASAEVVFEVPPI